MEDKSSCSAPSLAAQELGAHFSVTCLWSRLLEDLRCFLFRSCHQDAAAFKCRLSLSWIWTLRHIYNQNRVLVSLLSFNSTFLSFLSLCWRLVSLSGHSVPDRPDCDAGLIGSWGSRDPVPLLSIHSFTDIYCRWCWGVTVVLTPDVETPQSLSCSHTPRCSSVPPVLCRLPAAALCADNLIHFHILKSCFLFYSRVVKPAAQRSSRAQCFRGWYETLNMKWAQISSVLWLWVLMFVSIWSSCPIKVAEFTISNSSVQDTCPGPDQGLSITLILNVTLKRDDSRAGSAAFLFSVHINSNDISDTEDTNSY